MRYYPDKKDKYDAKNVRELQPKVWMLKALMLNPSYMGWGPHEDYMIQKEGQDYGWRRNQVIESWGEFNWAPDDLNLFANWYFQINRESKNCETCGGNGYHPDAQWVTESFYSHSSPFQPQEYQSFMATSIMAGFSGEKVPAFGSDVMMHSVMKYNSFPTREVLDKYSSEFEVFCRYMQEVGGWNTLITEDEAKALLREKRYPGWNWDKTKNPTAADYNTAQGVNGSGGGHDAINRMILCAARLKRYGIPKHCPTCKGEGYQYVDPEPRLDVVFWVLHPHKGCGRAVTVKNINEEQVSAVVDFLKRCYADFTKNNWQKVLDFNGEYPDSMRCFPSGRVWVNK